MRKRFKQNPVLVTTVCVKVHPVGGSEQRNMSHGDRETLLARARDISHEIRASNIDGVASVYTAVSTELVCEHCGSPWEVNWRGRPTCCDGTEWLG